jgi:hypothetical protein
MGTSSNQRPDKGKYFASISAKFWRNDRPLLLCPSASNGSVGDSRALINRAKASFCRLETINKLILQSQTRTRSSLDCTAHCFVTLKATHPTKLIDLAFVLLRFFPLWLTYFYVMLRLLAPQSATLLKITLYTLADFIQLPPKYNVFILWWKVFMGYDKCKLCYLCTRRKSSTLKDSFQHCLGAWNT